MLELSEDWLKQAITNKVTVRTKVAVSSEVIKIILITEVKVHSQCTQLKGHLKYKVTVKVQGLRRIEVEIKGHGE